MTLFGLTLLSAEGASPIFLSFGELTKNAYTKERFLLI